MALRRLPAADGALIQIVDATLADVARRSGEWLACRPGCMQCCVGVLAINKLDAVRLQQGLARLEKTDPQQARESAERLSMEFPGEAKTGVLDAAVFDECSEAERRFVEFGNDEPCPVLDPETGLCDLYNARPMACRGRRGKPRLYERNHQQPGRAIATPSRSLNLRYPRMFCCG